MKEFFKNIPSKILLKRKPKATTSTFGSTYSSDYKLSDFRKAYRQDELVQYCITLLAQFSTQKGFETKIQPLGDQDPQDYTDVKCTIDKMNKDINLDYNLYLGQIKRYIYGFTGFEILTDDNGIPTRLIPLESEKLKPDINENFDWVGFEYTSAESDYKREELFYLTTEDLDYNGIGMSKIEPVMHPLNVRYDIREDLKQASKRLWAPMGIFQVDTSAMDEDEEEKYLKKFKEQLKPGQSVITNKQIESKVVEMTPDLSAFVNALNKTEEEILGNFGIPKALVSKEKCAPGSTTIVDAETGERLTLDEWYKEGKAPCSLFTIDDNWKLRKTSDIDIQPAGVKPCVEVKTFSGKCVELSFDHPVKTFNGYKQAKDLTLDDKIAVPNYFNPNTFMEIPYHDLALIAAMISEGHNNTKWVESISAKNKKFQDFIIGMIKRRDPDVKIRVEKEKDIYVNPSRFWQKLFDQYDVRRGLSYEKSIPPVIFSLTEEQRLDFLSILYEGDGSLYCSRGQWKADYSTTSEELANQVKNLLLTSGINALISKQKVSYNGKECMPCYHVVVGISLELTKMLNKVRPFKWTERRERALEDLSKKNYPGTNHKYLAPLEVWDILERDKKEKSWSSLGITRRGHFLRNDKLKEINDELQSEKIKRYLEADVFFDKVISVKDTEEKSVYDVMARPWKNWFANEVCVSNTLTKATLESSLEALYEGPIKGIQQYLRREVERQLYDKVVKELGYENEIRVEHKWKPVGIYEYTKLAGPVAELVKQGVIDQAVAWQMLGLDTSYLRRISPGVVQSNISQWTEAKEMDKEAKEEKEEEVAT